MKLQTALIFIFSLHLLTPRLTWAQEIPASPSGEVLSETSNLDDIKKIRDLVEQKVREKLGQITKSGPLKRGWVGTVTQVSPSQITLTSASNQVRQLQLAPDITIIDNKRKKIEAPKLKVGDQILAMGYQNQSDSSLLDTKRIVQLSTPMVNPSQITLGKVVDISQSSPIFVLVPLQSKNLQYQVKSDTKTVFVDKNNQKTTSSGLKNGQKIIALLDPDTKNSQTFYATKIIFLESTTSISPTTSPSASPSPTPKLTGKPTKTPKSSPTPKP
jgi:hypothetical protein